MPRRRQSGPAFAGRATDPGDQKHNPCHSYGVLASRVDPMAKGNYTGSTHLRVLVRESRQGTVPWRWADRLETFGRSNPAGGCQPTTGRRRLGARFRSH
jgi:hypothetical protein